MGSNVFSPMAIDAIGEIFNISLGSSATAVSNMLARRVDITTPTVSVVSAKDFTLGDLQPAIGVKIDYVAGLSGSNIMLLKRSDVRAIVDILMGSTTKDEDFEINELNMSAICEVMNQMMGAASTAMSDFLNRMVNISTPQAFEIGSLEEFVEKYFPSNGMLVVVRFKFSVEDAVESEFMSALSMDLVRELLKGFGIEGEDVGMGAEPEPEPAAQPAAAAEPELSSGSGASLSQEEIEKLMAQNFAEEQAAQQNASPQPAVSAGCSNPGTTATCGCSPCAADTGTAACGASAARRSAGDAADVPGDAAAICCNAISAVWNADAVSAYVLYAAAAAGGSGAENH